MSLVKRVEEAIARIDAGDPMGALLPACAAVESSAHREFPSFKSSARRYRTFLATYGFLVDAVAFHGALPARVPAFASHPALVADAKGTYAREDVLYEIVRCGIVYAARIAEHVVITKGTRLGYEGGRYHIPAALPLGLVAAVVLSPSNVKQRLPGSVSLTLGKRPIGVNELWGNVDMVASLLKAGAL